MNTTNFKSMSDDQLIERVEYLVRRERELVECLIWHLQEIQDRRLFIQMGFASLFECLVKHFKYSEAVAYSRISALKIINAVPEAAEALNAGEVNVTTLSLAQSFIRKQEKESGEKVSVDQKVQYIESIKNKTVQEAKQILATISPVAELPADKIQYLDQHHAQLQITVEKSVLEKIEKLKALISHENIDPSHNQLLELALDAAIEKIEKKKGIYVSPKNKEDAPAFSVVRPAPVMAPELEKATQSFAVKSSRYISRHVKRTALKRSNNECEYVHPNGQRCKSTFQLQFDHVIAHSKGGKGDIGNIQTLCRVHNNHKGAAAIFEK